MMGDSINKEILMPRYIWDMAFGLNNIKYERGAEEILSSRSAQGNKKIKSSSFSFFCTSVFCPRSLY